MESSQQSMQGGEGDRADVVVIGAGFGGLGAALRLAEQGARVVLCESLKYPGGCAGTFDHKGYRFEAGATLSAGFAEGQLFQQWTERHGLDLHLEKLDPVVEPRTPSFELAVPSDRASAMERLAALPGAPEKRLRAFFDHQRRVADITWSLLDTPSLLPPFGVSAALRHAANLPRYLPVLRDLGRPLSSVIERHGLADWQPLTTYLDALCQITAQCSTDRAEAVFALGTIDYYFRGVAHVRGGLGQLAWELVKAIRNAGSEVRFTDRVRGLEKTEDGDWRVRTRRGSIRARAVIANLLPFAMRQLLPEGIEDRAAGPLRPQLSKIESRVETGWGAAMLYRGVKAAADAGPEARHLEIVVDESEGFVEGNHVFCSISAADEEGRAPDGQRTMTVSTHVDMGRLYSLDDRGQAEYIDEVHRRMRSALARFLPEWENVAFEATASPRTFERFTGRHRGFVGGIPRRAGFEALLDLWRRPALPEGIHCVGDSIFPGQSTLATALGGVRVADGISAQLARG